MSQDLPGRCSLKPKQIRSTDLRPFLFGGVAACVAEASTFPIDTAKTRLQLQGQRIDARFVAKRYNGMLHCWVRVVSEEGLRALYCGLSPALLRQAVYGTIKYGLYYSVKGLLPGPESTLRNVGCAIFSGCVSSAMANPTDLLKVRMQSASLDTVAKGSSTWACFKDIYCKEGLAGLWRGVVPTAQRSAIVAGVQLPVYDATKGFILNRGLMDDTPANHLSSSFLASVCACLASQPIDTIRTRLMNQRRLRHATAVSLHRGSTRIYKSSFDCAIWTVRKEGPLALYKGFIPAFSRMAPWNVIFFLVYEKLKKLSSTIH